MGDSKPKIVPKKAESPFTVLDSAVCLGQSKQTECRGQRFHLMDASGENPWAAFNGNVRVPILSLLDARGSPVVFGSRAVTSRPHDGLGTTEQVQLGTKQVHFLA